MKLKVPKRRRDLGLAACLPIAAAAGLIAVLSSEAGDWSPLSLVLALALFNVASETLHVRHQRRPGQEDWVITSTAPIALAIALLGLAPAVAIGFLGLIASDVVSRRDLSRRETREAVASNFAVYGTFIVTGSLLFEWLAGTWQLTVDDPGFIALTIAVYFYMGVLSLLLNALTGVLFWGESLWEQLRTERHCLSTDALVAPLAALTTYAYGAVGLGALGFLVLVQLAHQYLLNNLLLSQHRAYALEEQTKHLTELSASRGRLVGQVLQAEETERRRLAESLHDEALQNLLSAMRALSEPTSGAIEHARTGIQRTIDQLRGAIFNLHPDVLEHAGLGAALRAVARRQGEQAGFQADVDVDSGAESPHDGLLFVLAREQLHNAAKHSGATRVAVVVSRNEDAIVMDVRDNGGGMQAHHRVVALERGHIGLASSAERVEALGGRLEIESAPGTGTLIRTTLPLNAHSSNGASAAKLVKDAAAHRLGDGR